MSASATVRPPAKAPTVYVATVTFDTVVDGRPERIEAGRMRVHEAEHELIVGHPDKFAPVDSPAGRASMRAASSRSARPKLPEPRSSARPSRQLTPSRPAPCVE